MPRHAVGKVALSTQATVNRPGESGDLLVGGTAARVDLRIPPEVISLVVRWYLHTGLSCRDLVELLAERGTSDQTEPTCCVHRTTEVLQQTGSHEDLEQPGVEMTTYYGKYRGTVVDNIDPMLMGRLEVFVPSLGVPSAWAMPCFPVTGDQAGAWMIPSPGTGVWVEFEQGEVDNPIWSGCWYGSAAEVPPLVREASPTAPPIVFQTRGQTAVMLSDAPGPTGGILLQTATGGSISITDLGITLSNGKGATITLVGSTITLNEGALVVT